MKKEVSYITPLPELISLKEAKEFMNIDFDDFDSLISMLINSSISQAEKTMGKYIYPREITFKGKTWEEGFNDAEEVPFDIRNGILQSVATGFAYRQDGITESINQTVNSSIYIFRSHIDTPMI